MVPVFMNASIFKVPHKQIQIRKHSVDENRTPKILKVHF